MSSDILFSVIIPQKNSIDSLPRLFSSIPNRDDIEIILVDNSEEPITKSQVGIDRDYILCWSSPARFAGGARNVGMEQARGRWLVFSDADDYFSDGAFDTFFDNKDNSADVIYFCMEGIYPDTGEKSSSGDVYTNLVQRYLINPQDNINIRVSFHSPCAKMIKREFVFENNFKYDEVIANNDDYFAMLVGYNAKEISAVNKVVYTYVATRGSLMHKRSYNVIRTRYEVILRKNKYLKEHGLSKMQGSISWFLVQSFNYGIKGLAEFISLLIKYKQNPFIGFSNWGRTVVRLNKLKQKENEYIE